MLRGVNKRIIEVNDTDSDYFEKALFFVKENAEVTEGKAPAKKTTAKKTTTAKKSTTTKSTTAKKTTTTKKTTKKTEEKTEESAE